MWHRGDSEGWNYLHESFGYTLDHLIVYHFVIFALKSIKFALKACYVQFHALRSLYLLQTTEFLTGQCLLFHE